MLCFSATIMYGIEHKASTNCLCIIRLRFYYPNNFKVFSSYPFSRMLSSFNNYITVNGDVLYGNRSFGLDKESLVPILVMVMNERSTFYCHCPSHYWDSCKSALTCVFTLHVKLRGTCFSIERRYYILNNIGDKQVGQNACFVTMAR